MIKVTLLMNTAKTCPANVAKLLQMVSPKFEKSVPEMTRMAKCAKGTPLDDFYTSLQKAGEELVGENGTINLTTRASEKCNDASIVTVIFKKGEEVIAKMANWISPAKQKTGGVINQHVNGTIVPGRFRL